MKSQSSVSFDFEEAEGSTQVTWHMNGNMPFFLGWMIPMMNTFIAMDYRRGLLMPKEWMETGEISSRVEIVGLTTSPAFRLAGVRQTCSVFDIGPSMEQAMQEAKEKLQGAGISIEGGGASAYYDFDMKAATFDYVSGFLVPDDAQLPAGMTEWITPEEEAFSVIHTGPYSHLGNGWAAGYQHVRNAGLPKKQKKTPTFEIYKTSPEDTDPQHHVTQIYMPVRNKILGFF